MTATWNTSVWLRLSRFYKGNEALSRDCSCKMTCSVNFPMPSADMNYLLRCSRAPDSYEICELAQSFPLLNLLTTVQLNPFEQTNPALSPLTTHTLSSLYNELYCFRRIKRGFTNWFEWTKMYFPLSWLWPLGHVKTQAWQHELQGSNLRRLLNSRSNAWS